MASLADDSDNPSLIQSFIDIKTGFLKYLEVSTYSNGQKFNSVFNFSLLLSDFVSDLQKYFRISLFEICLTVALAMFMTVFRHFLTHSIIQPFSVYMKLNPSSRLKFPESAWKLIYYIVVCSYLTYVMILSGDNDYFQKPYDIWNDYYSQISVPAIVGGAFLLEFSYYLHSLYGTMYLDCWRKDSPIMLFHHVLCLLLIGFSYATRYHKVGILLMFVHDYCDVFLEFSKCQVYMKYRDGKYYRSNDIIATISFFFFTTSWFIGRLYLFPIVVIRSCSYSTMFSGVEPTLPFYLVFNVLLWFMLALNIYWFILVLKFLYKVVSGQMKDLDDIRDYDVDDKLNQQASHKDSNNHHDDHNHHDHEQCDHNHNHRCNGDSSITNGGGGDGDVGGGSGRKKLVNGMPKVRSKEHGNGTIRRNKELISKNKNKN